MNKISIRQKDLIETIQRRVYSADMVIGILWGFLTGKPKAEPLDPRWRDIWREYQSKVQTHIISPQMIKTIDKEMESIKGSN